MLILASIKQSVDVHMRIKMPKDVSLERANFSSYSSRM